MDLKLRTGAGVHAPSEPLRGVPHFHASLTVWNLRACFNRGVYRRMRLNLRVYWLELPNSSGGEGLHAPTTPLGGAPFVNKGTLPLLIRVY